MGLAMASKALKRLHKDPIWPGKEYADWNWKEGVGWNDGAMGARKFVCGRVRCESKGLCLLASLGYGPTMDDIVDGFRTQIFWDSGMRRE